jgi:hypothetical protein
VVVVVEQGWVSLLFGREEKWVESVVGIRSVAALPTAPPQKRVGTSFPKTQVCRKYT